MDVLPEEFSEEKGDGHDGRPEKGGPAFDQKRIKDKKDDQQDIRNSRLDAQEFQKGKHQKKDDGDVAAGEGKKVEEAGFLEGLGGRGVHPASLSEDQGLEDGSFQRHLSRRFRGGEILFDSPLEFLAQDGHPAEKNVGPVGLDFFDEERTFCRSQVVEKLVLEKLLGEGLVEIPVFPQGHELGRDLEDVSGRKIEA
jgi:hypothetical protein